MCSAAVHTVESQQPLAQEPPLTRTPYFSVNIEHGVLLTYRCQLADGLARGGRYLSVKKVQCTSGRCLHSLEKYYARNLGAYYEALTVGPSHNYYEGRAKANSTK